jgi:hypothetical protein
LRLLKSGNAAGHTFGFLHYNTPNGKIIEKNVNYEIEQKIAPAFEYYSQNVFFYGQKRKVGLCFPGKLAIIMENTMD